MRRFLSGVIICLAMIAPAAFAQGKVTVDPNAPGVQRAASSTDETDPRLSQKITYDSGYQRLHRVTDDVAKLGGISLSCGQNSKDWRVRDIPLVVCVKDMPLGKLLRAIADATHTRVASEKVGDSTTRAYRIYRRAKEEAEIDSLLQIKRQIKLDRTDWEWDALAAYGKSERIPGVSALNWSVARLIAKLGQDAKQRLFAGETLRFSGRDAAYKEIMHDLYQDAWKQMSSGFRDHTTDTEPAAADAESAILAIKFVDTGEAGDTDIEVCLSPVTFGKAITGWTSSLGWAKELDGKLPGLRPYPKDALNPSLKDDMDNADMIPLRNSAAAEWNYDVLKKKIDLQKPAELKEPVFADVIRAVAQSSGCNIVAEDFVSHTKDAAQWMGPAFQKDTTAADAIRKRYYGGWFNYTWFFSRDDQLLVGWAHDGNARSWRDHHRNLLPESYLSDLNDKLNGKGVELDDVAHMSTLSQDSFMEWIWYSRSLWKDLGQARAEAFSLWRLYDSLDAADKQAARSQSGLPFAKLDAAWIAQFFREQRMGSSAYVIQIKADEAEQKAQGESEERRERAFADPNVIETMVMRIQGQPARMRTSWETMASGGYGMTMAAIPPQLKLTQYNLTLSYEMDGATDMFMLPLGNLAFPIRSAEAEAAIMGKNKTPVH